MKKLITILLTFTTLISLSALPEQADIPDWYLNPPEPENKIVGLGAHKADNPGSSVILSLVHSLGQISTIAAAKYENAETTYDNEEGLPDVKFEEAVLKGKAMVSIGTCIIHAVYTDYLQTTSNEEGEQTISFAELIEKVLLPYKGGYVCLTSTVQDSAVDDDADHKQHSNIEPDFSPRDFYYQLMAILEEAGCEIEKYFAEDGTVYTKAVISWDAVKALAEES